MVNSSQYSIHTLCTGQLTQRGLDVRLLYYGGCNFKFCLSKMIVYNYMLHGSPFKKKKKKGSIEVIPAVPLASYGTCIVIILFVYSTRH